MQASTQGVQIRLHVGFLEEVTSHLARLHRASRLSLEKEWEACFRQRDQQHMGRPREGKEPCSNGPGLK